METHALEILAKLNTVGYKSLKIHPTVDGMVGVFKDKVDGQVYEVRVTPQDALTCRVCGDVCPAAEIMENAGDCDYCHFANERVEKYQERKHPDEP